METKKFIDILEIYNGKNQKSVENPDGKYPIYGSGGVMGRADEYICPAETVVIGRKGSINNPIFVTEPFWNVDTAFGLVARKEILLPKYLFYFCRYFDFEKLNTTVTIPSLTKANLLKIEIPIPSIIEQKSIVTKLNLLTDMIQQHQEQLTKLDELIKARFVEMFGDPSDNAEGWPILSLNDIISTIESGWSGNGKQRKKAPGEIAVLKVSAVTKGYFIPTECKVLDDQSNIKKYVFPQKGDLLFSRANTREMVGATALINQDYPELILPDKLWKIQFSENVDVVYMKYILSSKTIRDLFSAASTGTSGSMYNVSMEKFRSIVVPIPPLSLQNQFADFVAEVDKFKFVILLLYRFFGTGSICKRGKLGVFYIAHIMRPSRWKT